MDMVGKGIVVLENLFDDEAGREVVVDGKKTTVRGMRGTRWVHPRYYGFPSIQGERDALMLNTREVAMVNPQFAPETTDTWAPFPEHQFLVGIMKRKSGHPLNSSLLRILGFWWAGTNFVWEYFLNFTSLFGTPFRWANYDPNMPEADKAELDSFLANMGAQAWARFPSGTELHLIEAAKSGNQVAHKVWIDEANAICDKLILGQTLTSDQGAIGSQALGTVHKDVRDEKVQAVASRTAKVINTQLIPAICLINFGDTTECPFIVPSSKNTGDALVKIQRDQIALAIAPVSKTWFYARHEMPQPEDGEETIGGPAPAPKIVQDDDAAAAPAQAAAKAAGPTVLVENGKDLLLHAIQTDLAVFHAKLAAAAAITDPDQQRAAVQRVLDSIENYKRNLDKTSATSEAVERIMAAEFANGLTEKAH